MRIRVITNLTVFPQGETISYQCMQYESIYAFSISLLQIVRVYTNKLNFYWYFLDDGRASLILSITEFLSQYRKNPKSLFLCNC